MVARHTEQGFPKIVSPWVVIGSSLILLIIITVLTVMTINWQRAAASKVLLEKGQALIKALEAGSRMGVRGRFAQGVHLRHLLQEMAKLPGIAFIEVTDSSGRIIASGDFTRIGSTFHPRDPHIPLTPSDTPQWFMDKDENDAAVFVVYSTFKPLRRLHGNQHGRHLRRGFFTHPMPSHPPHNHLQGGASPPQKMVMYLGLMATSMRDAQQSDLIHSVVMSCMVLLMGLAGFISLFWAQNLRVSQRLFSDSRAFASEVVANLPQGLIVVSPGGEIVFKNASAHAFGLFADVCGKEGAKAMPSIPQAIRPIINRLEQERVVYEQEIVCHVKGGRSLPLGVSGRRITTEDGRFLGKIILLRDLREVRRLQQEVKRKEKLAAIGRLAAGVAHEIRNPLSSIKGFATLLRTRFARDSEEYSAADIMVHEVDRLNHVVTELIEYARPWRIVRQQTDLTHLIEHSLSLIQHDMHKAGVQVEQDIPAWLSPVFLDSERMQQCLLNLYLNAVHAMPQGGVLRVEAFQEEEGLLGLRISDTGKGIAKEDLSKIFDPYYTTKHQGTGLGLAMVLKIVEAHGGDIDIVSDKGEGSVITLVLPGYEQDSTHPLNKEQES